MFRTDKVFERFGFDPQEFERRPLHVGRLKCRSNGKQEKFNYPRFDVGMDTEFVSLGKSTRKAIEVQM